MIESILETIIVLAVVVVLLAIEIAKRGIYALVPTVVIGGSIWFIRTMFGAELDFFTYLRPFFVGFWIIGILGMTLKIHRTAVKLAQGEPHTN